MAHAMIVCEGCGSAGRERRIEPGSNKIELVLWLLFVLPGYIYRLWRRANGRSECMACGARMFAVDATTTEVKPLTLGHDGRVLALSKAAGVDLAVRPFTALLTPAGVDVVGVEPHLLSKNVVHQAWFPFHGSHFEVLDSGRSAGKAAFGALAGGLLAGPLGLVVGAAIGGRKAHAVMAVRGASTLVFEATPTQLQALAARGVLR